jgi:hypothetical protein
MTRVPCSSMVAGMQIMPGMVVMTLFCAGFGPIAPANAQTFGSSYTSSAPKDCHVSATGDDGDDSTMRVCPGKAGLKVLINEGDLRETVSVGRSRIAAANEPAAQARFGPFNSTTATVEWRARNSKPFAIIQRWQIADNDDVDRDGRPIARPMLVVTRLPPGAVCHVAYIDVTANPDADELARKTADKDARGFKCGTDAVKVIGASGRAVELALRR